MAKEFLTAYGEWLNGACGVQHLSDFEYSMSDYRKEDKVEKIRPGGIGLLTAGFINTDNCKAAYEKLCKTHKLVYRSPIRKNVNSNNWFFFAVFDAGSRTKDPDLAAEWFGDEHVLASSDYDEWDDE